VTQASASVGAGRKLAIVAETYQPGMSVSLVARRHGIAPNQVFSGRLTTGCCNIRSANFNGFSAGRRLRPRS
jgi:hypothetical protein